MTRKERRTSEKGRAERRRMVGARKREIMMIIPHIYRSAPLTETNAVQSKQDTRDIKTL